MLDSVIFFVVIEVLFLKLFRDDFDLVFGDILLGELEYGIRVSGGGFWFLESFFVGVCGFFFIVKVFFFVELLGFGFCFRFFCWVFR